MKTMQERFDEKYIGEPNSGCWLWTAAVCSGGYGCIGESVTRKILPAHRVSWELHKGKIPDGLWVLHKCDVRECVNPDHLFLGTVKDNGADMAAKGRSRRNKKYGKQKNPCSFTSLRGEVHPNSKLRDSDVIEIINSREKEMVLVRKFGISQAVVNSIRKRKTWKHIGG